MKLSPTRELARRYAAGDLSLDDYRSQRRDLIDGVCSGTQPFQYGQTTSHIRRKPAWLIWVPLVIVLAAGAAVTLGVMYARHPSESGLRYQVLKQSGSQLLSEFLDANDWSEASITHFVARWKQLPLREQQATRNSYIYPRMTAQLQEQIVSQQAMLEVAPDPKAAVRHLAHLQEMAAQLAGPQANQ